MIEHPEQLLSAYVDDDVTALERMRVEAHLAACERCRADVEGLRRLVRRARSLDDRPPARDLWPGIASGIAGRSAAGIAPPAGRRRRFAFTLPELAAAAAVLVALSVTTATLLLRAAGAARPVASGAARPALRELPPDQQLTAGYAGAIADLQRALDQRRGRLDTATVRVIRQSLAVVDVAIRQAQQALAADPASPYLNSQLRRALDQKLDVLRRAVSLPSAI